MATPIDVRPSNGDGIPAPGRPATLRAMSPAVRHAIYGRPLTVSWLATVIRHARSTSRSRVNRLPGSAHGTDATTTPRMGQSTRGIMAVFCQIFVGRFGVSFSPFERLFLGRFGFGQSCG
ncbi:MAG: hypothetical protein E7D16_09765, partial [Bifidobacterium breve]|nr:hypothetical protein [Bifidobacterium breve]